MNKKEREIQEYKNAVWDYLLEHSDVTKGGALFVKFHTDGRKKFENRIHSRMDGYHRGDPREREQIMNHTKEAHISEKTMKKIKMKEDKMDRIRMQADIKREIERVTVKNRRMVYIKKILNVILEPFKKMLHIN